MITGFVSRLRGGALKAFATITLFLLIGRLAGAVKEIAIAFEFGIGPQIDAYVYALALVGWPVACIFSVFVTVFIPTVRSTADTSEVQLFFRELVHVVLLSGLALAVALFFVLPRVATSPWSGLPATAASFVMTATPYFVLVAWAGVISSLLSANLMRDARHHGTLIEGLPALVIAGVLLATPPGDSFDVLLWATVAGALAQLLALYAFAPFRIAPSQRVFASKLWRPFWRGFGIILLGNFAMSFSSVVDQFFAARFEAGSVSSLGYASRLLALFTSLGTVAVSRTLMPVLSAESGHIQRRRVALAWARACFIGGIALAVILWALSEPLVRLLFERGKFDSADTAAVAMLFVYGLAQLPFFLSGMALVSLLASNRRYKPIALGAAVNLVLKIAASFALVPLFGLPGLLIATAFMYAASCAWLYYACREEPQ